MRHAHCQDGLLSVGGHLQPAARYRTSHKTTGIVNTDRNVLMTTTDAASAGSWRYFSVEVHHGCRQGAVKKQNLAIDAVRANCQDSGTGCTKTADNTQQRTSQGMTPLDRTNFRKPVTEANHHPWDGRLPEHVDWLRKRLRNTNLHEVEVNASDCRINQSQAENLDPIGAHSGYKYRASTGVTR